MRRDQRSSHLKNSGLNKIDDSREMLFGYDDSQNRSNISDMKVDIVSDCVRNKEKIRAPIENKVHESRTGKSSNVMNGTARTLRKSRINKPEANVFDPKIKIDEQDIPLTLIEEGDGMQSKNSIDDNQAFDH